MSQKPHPHFLVNICAHATKLVVLDTHTDKKFVIEGGYQFQTFAWFNDMLYVVTGKGPVKENNDQLLEIDPVKQTKKNVWSHGFFINDIHITDTNMYCIAKGDGSCWMLLCVGRHDYKISHVYASCGEFYNFKILGAIDGGIYLTNRCALFRFDLGEDGYKSLWNIPIDEAGNVKINKHNGSVFVINDAWEISEHEAATGNCVAKIKSPSPIASISVDRKTLVVCTKDQKGYSTDLSEVHEGDKSNREKRLKGLKYEYEPLKCFLDFSEFGKPFRIIHVCRVDEFILKGRQVGLHIKGKEKQMIDWSDTPIKCNEFEPNLACFKSKSVYGITKDGTVQKVVFPWDGSVLQF